MFSSPRARNNALLVFSAGAIAANALLYGRFTGPTKTDAPVDAAAAAAAAAAAGPSPPTGPFLHEPPARPTPVTGYSLPVAGDAPAGANLRANLYNEREWDWNWDGRHEQYLARVADLRERERAEGLKEGTLSRRRPSHHVLLIRHGRYYQDESQSHRRMLDIVGVAQANLLGNRLSGLLTASRPPVTGEEAPLSTVPALHSCMPLAVKTCDANVRLYSSDAPRALQTGLIARHQALIAANAQTGGSRVPLNIVVDADLREGFPCVPGPIPDNANGAREMRQWTRRMGKAYLAEEPLKLERAFRRYIHRPASDQTVDTVDVIFCHANVIRYFTTRAMQWPSSDWLRMLIPHTSITQLTIRPDGRVTLSALADSAHTQAWPLLHTTAGHTDDHSPTDESRSPDSLGAHIHRDEHLQAGNPSSEVAAAAALSAMHTGNMRMPGVVGGSHGLVDVMPDIVNLGFGGGGICSYISSGKSSLSEIDEAPASEADISSLEKVKK
ncbi:hypothetical protein H696_01673 [Fonticula alba]|uniref:Serine/threonine-protein phosphatase PGAM5, mitochondrial n=1 Tax=Fonticula alba TaxID=691883 RepID=A0A058ZCY7_FONAL|nr:hypothetical protein H696_01673 [Fonticula alba]KCV72275.1 hypothetical protein H696_01673 [Fonticula alba]|eukprot:XP_009493853.1 hypothetical protein H696_01673 [Fonticula alba]